MKKVIPVLPEHIRSLKSPHDPKVRTQYAFVALADVPDDLPLSPNPRVPKPGAVITRVKSSLASNSGTFHILNRGITISAKSADYDNGDQTLTLDIPDGEEAYGILDGGHTYEVVRSMTGHPPQADEQYIKLEILTGVEPILPEIASARNFSRQVQAISLANYSKKLEWLRHAMGSVADKLRWSENDDQEFDVMEYIQVIAAFDIKRYGEGSHPLESYKNAGKCLDAATGGALTYLSPVVPNIMRLYDTVRYEWWPFYNAGDEDGKRGRGGKRKEVQGRKRGISKLLQFPMLPDADPAKALYHVERGLAIPLVAAFRALLTMEDDGSPKWIADPFAFWESNGGALVRKLMEASDQRGSIPQVVGRDPSVYSALYDSVELLHLKSQR